MFNGDQRQKYMRYEKMNSRFEKSASSRTEMIYGWYGNVEGMI